MTVSSAGTYLLLVDGPGGAAEQSGSYELSITVIRAVERSCRTYTIEPADGAIPDRAAGAVTFPIDVADAADDRPRRGPSRPHAQLHGRPRRHAPGAGRQPDRAVRRHRLVDRRRGLAHAGAVRRRRRRAAAVHLVEGARPPARPARPAELVRGPAVAGNVEPHLPRRFQRGRRAARPGGPDPVRAARGGAGRDGVRGRVRERRRRLHAFRHRRRVGARHALDPGRRRPRRAGELRRGNWLLRDRPRWELRGEQLAGPRVTADLARRPHRPDLRLLADVVPARNGGLRSLRRIGRGGRRRATRDRCSRGPEATCSAATATRSWPFRPLPAGAATAPTSPTTPARRSGCGSIWTPTSACNAGASGSTTCACTSRRSSWT